MPDKSRRLLTLLTVLTLAMLVLTGCGKFGNKFPNDEPTIAITSYEGFDDSELLAPYADTDFLFQQKIFWNATDTDGIINRATIRKLSRKGPFGAPIVINAGRGRQQLVHELLLGGGVCPLLVAGAAGDPE